MEAGGGEGGGAAAVVVDGWEQDWARVCCAPNCLPQRHSLG
jgi:hypothetical protein